jgi:alpha-glucosidase (family GH31 glycosyl hydrolase)
MIRHRPSGKGHPYLLEPDQRVPVQPLAGEPVELRASTAATVDGVAVEIERDGVVEVVPAAPASAVPADVERDASTASAGGHLAAAARGSTGSRRAWSATVDAPPAGRVRYRFRTNGSAPRRTRWFEFGVARWQQEGGRLRLSDPSGTLASRLDPGSISWLVGDAGPERVRFALALDAGEHAVGFGERFDALDQRGRALDSVVFEQYKHQGSRTYMPIPFAIVCGDSPWGFHVATSRRVWFDVGKRDENRLWIEAKVDPRRPELVLELYDGPPAAVLRAFLDATAAPALPPDWVFELWMSSNEWHTQAQVMAEVERGAREGIPAGVVVIEAWSDESMYTAFRDAQCEPRADGGAHRLADFSFPADGAWPDPKGMVDELHARGMKLVLWQIPALKAWPPPQGQARYDREAAIAHGYVVREADGRPYRNRHWWFPGSLVPDLTNPDARAWWRSKRRYLVEELGVDGFKTDGGEHLWGDDLRYADGTTGAESNNRYPVLYAQTYHELFAELGRPPVTFSRSGHTGAAAFPCHWAGDESSTWEAYRASITAGLTAGASGIFFWGWDIAGFSGEIPSAELYLRSAAAACFCPIMQYHSEFNRHRLPSIDRTPWNIAERTGDPRVLPVFKRFADLRRRLLPYIVEQARAAVDRRVPLMRALLFDVHDDPRIWEFPRQYFFGDDLLVAPVTEPSANAWRVYLPAGAWVDAWSGERIEGPRVVDRAVPLDVIPVYVREAAADALVPLFAAVEGD